MSGGQAQPYSDARPGEAHRAYGPHHRIGRVGVLGRWLGRERQNLLLAGTLLVVGLIVAGLFRNGYVSFPWLKANKDAIGALTNLGTFALLTAGGLASYYRFFKGRTLSVRAELKLEAEVIPTAEGDFMHAVSVQIRNVGNLTIWRPHGTLSARPHPAVTELPNEPVDIISSEMEGRKAIRIVDVGSTDTIFYEIRVPATVWAVSYVATVRAEGREFWVAARTIANKAKDE